MIAELISVASFVLMVAETCYMIKIYNMVKSIRPSGNERVPMEYARANQRALPLIREPAVCFPIAESSAEQRGTPNYITYGGSEAIRPSGNERALMEYARANQRALPAKREPAVCFPRAESSAEQRGTPNYITYDGLQVIRRQPQMHDERFA